VSNQVIEVKRVEYLYENLPSALMALFLLLSATYYIYQPYITPFNLNIWYLVGILLIAVRIFSYKRFIKLASVGDFSQLERRYKEFFILTALTALHLGSGALIVLPKEIEAQIVLLFFIGGLVSGATVTMATYSGLYKTYLMLTLVPYIITILVNDEKQSGAMAFSMILYMIFLIVIAKKIMKSVNANIELVQNNFELVMRLEQEVKAAKVADEAKSKFLSVMSHELRTPLNAIIGFSQIIMRKENLDSQVSVFIEKINIAGKNLLTLVNSILDFSKIDKGEMQCHLQTIHFSSILQEINILLEPQISEKKIDYHFFKAGELVLFADAQLLKQAFVNVLTNAVKFTPNGGTIEFTHDIVDSKHLFCIKDSGGGIAPEDIELLFEPFKQAKNARQNAISGTGLGLAITAKIIRELHKGEVWVESELGKGTAFYIKL
jgi:signal transduction histidine kinase